MRRGGEDVEIVSTGCRSPSVLHPWMLLLHMQETALWIHRLGPLSSRGGVQISWMLLLHMQETVFVDSPSVLCPLEGGPRHIGTSLTTVYSLQQTRLHHWIYPKQIISYV